MESNEASEATDESVKINIEDKHDDGVKVDSRGQGDVKVDNENTSQSLDRTNETSELENEETKPLIATREDTRADVEDGYKGKKAKDGQKEAGSGEKVKIEDKRGDLDGGDPDIESVLHSEIKHALSQTWHAPDGGWGWVIVVSSLVISLIVDGLTYTFGLFLSHFQKAFDQPKSTIALAGSLQVGIYLMIGPVVSALTNRFGCRPIIMAGSFLASFAFIISSWSPTVTMLILTYGVIGGIGFGMMYLPAIVAVSIYFEKRRAVATGIAVCGSGIGTFILAPLTELWIYEYNWNWTLCLLGALVLNGVVFGALVRPLELTPSGDPDSVSRKSGISKKSGLDDLEARPAKEKKKRYRKISSSSSNRYTPENIPMITLTDELDNTTVMLEKNKKKETLSAPRPGNLFFSSVPNMVIDSPSQLSKAVSKKGGRKNSNQSVQENILPRLRANTVDISHRLRSHSTSEKAGDPTHHKRRSQAPIGLAFIGLSDAQLHKIRDDSHVPLSRRDLRLTGSLAELAWDFLPKDKSQSLYIQSIRSISTIGSKEADDVTKRGGFWGFLPESARETLEEMLNFGILKDKKYWFVLLGNFCAMIGFYVPFVYVPQRAAQLGIEEESAAFLLSIIGITNTVGRVMTGVIINFFNIDCVLVTSLALLLSGVMTIVCPLCESYVALALVSAIFGLCVAAYISLCSILLCELLGVQNLTNAFGFVILFRGVACIIGPPMAGAMIDATGVYDLAFFVGGGMIVLGALSHFVLYTPCIDKMKKVS